MTELEPFYNWLHLYNPEEDERSPYYGISRNESEYTQQIYNYYISPYWDDIGSKTLYCKVLFVEYDERYAIIELVGEWNDAIENDIMYLKRDLVDGMIEYGINKFIFISENVLNFHSSDESYYEEWQEDVEEEGGYMILLNMPEHTKREMVHEGVGKYFFYMDYDQWRTHTPQHFFQWIDAKLNRLL